MADSGYPIPDCHHCGKPFPGSVATRSGGWVCPECEYMNPWVNTETTANEKRCDYFHEIGAGVCDNCGRRASEHKGVRTIRREAKALIFSLPDDEVWENLTWEEWDARVTLSKRAREARKKIAALPPEVVIGLVEGLTGEEER